MFHRLKNKTALVTGASSGIGRAFAEQIAAAGGHLVLAARSTKTMQTLAEELHKRHGVSVKVIGIDLSEAGAAERLHAEVTREGMVVDLLINNAGYGKWGSLLTVDREVYANMIALNVQTVVDLCHLFLPHLRTVRGGILNVASTAALVPVPYAAVYAASKAFVLSFSESLHGEEKSRGVTVTALCPGGTETGFAKVARGKEVEFRGMTADAVATAGLKAWLAQKPYVVPGSNNYLSAGLLPRFLPRAAVIRIVAGMWSKIAGEA